MNDVLKLPWLEAAIVVPLLGAIAVGQLRNPIRAARSGLFFASATLGCTFLAAFAYLNTSTPSGGAWDFQQRLFGQRMFRLDDLNVPLVPTAALLHVLTTLATTRTKMKQFSMPWAL